jgi:hypothetical protein
MKRLNTLLEENYLPLSAIWRAESELTAVQLKHRTNFSAAC